MPSGEQAGRIETGRKKSQMRTGHSRSCHPLSWRGKILEAAYIGREVITGPLPVTSFLFRSPSRCQNRASDSHCWSPLA